MMLGRVVGTVVCSAKTKSLTGVKLMIVRKLMNGVEGDSVIACDATRQAGIGDTVYLIGGKEAALLLDRDDPPPSDLSIAGIVD